MNIWDFLKGPYTRNVTTGTKGSCTRPGLPHPHRYIQYMTLEYTTKEVGRQYWMPWVPNTQVFVVQVDTTAHCEDGRELYFGLIVEGDLTSVLDYAFKTSIEAAVQQVRNEQRMFLRDRCKAGTRH